MTDKYYTPTLEEFHVGFEYEITNGYEWITKIFSKQDLKSFLYEKLENGIAQEYIRVKYLDKEDIESLGFKYDNNAEPIPYRENYTGGRKINSYFLAIETGVESHHYFLYHFDDNIVWIEYILDGSTVGYIFKGTIKNKSELKRILKQINIK